MADTKLAGQTAIVTGSTRGIGAAIARTFGERGANVVVSGRTVEDGKSVAEDIRAKGGEAHFVECDMADLSQVTALVNKTVKTYGTVDTVVNNAATWRHGAFPDRSVEDWDTVLDVNLKAPWYLVKEALDHLAGGGSVVNVSSVHAVQTDPGRFPYNVAKAGVDGLTRALAVECGPIGVRSNGIRPGWIRLENDGRTGTETDKRYQDLVPLQEVGEPEDVAPVVAFLASDDARYVTGATFSVDGGWMATLLDDHPAYDQFAYGDE
jgi:NAD(P)-dependent dehydrogenase (short-subunit alcohol dehydrogenase family)